MHRKLNKDFMTDAISDTSKFSLSSSSTSAEVGKAAILSKALLQKRKSLGARSPDQAAHDCILPSLSSLCRVTVDGAVLSAR
jgi:hypothetical protein